MAKPICVIYYYPEINGNRIDNSELNISMSKVMTDYYVFCVPSYRAEDGSQESLEFKVYHEKDFTEIQYAELKEIILNHINDNHS